ncbi:MAG: hypothetical protein ABJA20_10135, partial [Novosphingobium sp.]
AENRLNAVLIGQDHCTLVLGLFSGFDEISKFPPGRFMRGILVSHVQAVFNDPEKGEAPVVRSREALSAPNSVIWRVHGDVTTFWLTCTISAPDRHRKFMI